MKTNDTIVCEYTKKHKDSNGKIIGYTIRDTNGTEVNIYSDDLKNHIRTGRLEVTNLTLTSDNRLVEGSKKVTVSNRATDGRVDDRADDRALDDRALDDRALDDRALDDRALDIMLVSGKKVFRVTYIDTNNILTIADKNGKTFKIHKDKAIKLMKSNRMELLGIILLPSGDLGACTEHSYPTKLQPTKSLKLTSYIDSDINRIFILEGSQGNRYLKYTSLLNYIKTGQIIVDNINLKDNKLILSYEINNDDIKKGKEDRERFLAKATMLGGQGRTLYDIDVVECSNMLHIYIPYTVKTLDRDLERIIFESNCYKENDSIDVKISGGVGLVGVKNILSFLHNKINKLNLSELNLCSIKSINSLLYRVNANYIDISNLDLSNVRFNSSIMESINTDVLDIDNIKMPEKLEHCIAYNSNIKQIKGIESIKEFIEYQKESHNQIFSCTEFNPVTLNIHNSKDLDKLYLAHVYKNNLSLNIENLETGSDTIENILNYVDLNSLSIKNSFNTIKNIKNCFSYLSANEVNIENSFNNVKSSTDSFTRTKWNKLTYNKMDNNVIKNKFTSLSYYNFKDSSGDRVFYTGCHTKTIEISSGNCEIYLVRGTNRSTRGDALIIPSEIEELTCNDLRDLLSKSEHSLIYLMGGENLKSLDKLAKNGLLSRVHTLDINYFTSKYINTLPKLKESLGITIANNIKISYKGKIMY